MEPKTNSEIREVAIYQRSLLSFSRLEEGFEDDLLRQMIDRCERQGWKWRCYLDPLKPLDALGPIYESGLRSRSSTGSTRR